MDLLIGLSAVISLAVPGRTNATPSVAADGRFVAIVWSASDSAGATDIYLAVSRDAALTFGPPVRVNDMAGDARANGEQPPRVALFSNPGGVPAVTVMWAAKGNSGTRLVWARSDDGGRSFGASSTLPDSDAPGNRGWHNMAVDSSGRIIAVWLDHRALASDESMPSAHHEHAGSGKPDGVVMAQKSKILFESLAGGLAPHPIAAGVCYCCKTALATGGNGEVYVAWRHVYAGNLRDIAFARSVDGGRSFTPPTRVSEDGWILEGCPDDGPAIAITAPDRVHVVWPTLIADGEGRESIGLFYAATKVASLAFSRRMQLPTEGLAHHPQVATGADGTLFVAWDEAVAGARRAVVARARPGSDVPDFVRTVVSDGRPAVYPAIAVAGSTAVVAWTANRGESSVIGVSTLANESR